MERVEAPVRTWTGDAQAIADRCIAAGRTALEQGRTADAEAHFREALTAWPDAAAAHEGLGRARELAGAEEEAETEYRETLRLAPGAWLTRRWLAMLLVRQGRVRESVPLWRAELESGPAAVEWMTGLVTECMQHKDLHLAGEYARILAELRWASPFHPAPENGPALPPVAPPEVFLSVGKLRHDSAQFEYLRQCGELDERFDPIIAEYRRIADRMEAEGVTERVPLGAEEHRSIGPVYNRLVHVRHTPRVKKALSDRWDPAAAERTYLDRRLGLVVLDDFLTEEALEGIRAFCLGSTMWTGNRYAHGRLGAFFHDGFNCPLLLQIAEELRAALPQVLIDRYPLRQYWGFKNDACMPAGSNVHADFAAVNANFWITPEEANLDPTSGGLVVYDVDAPPSWDFHTYNGRPDVINSYLERHNARAVHIPYKQNRAIIFNSDLFHASAGIRFKPGYTDRRINITMLFGDREHDEHYTNTARDMDTHSGPQGNWRSASLSRARR